MRQVAPRPGRREGKPLSLQTPPDPRFCDFLRAISIGKLWQPETQGLHRVILSRACRGSAPSHRFR